MSSSNTDKSLPVVHLVSMGHEGHGKTTLVQALSSVFNANDESTSVAPNEINKTPEDSTPGIAPIATFDYNSRRYSLVDCPGEVSYTSASPLAQADAAILVCSAADGPMPHTREYVLLSRQVGVPHIVVFLNKADLVDDAELIDLVKLELRELFDKYDYPGAETPIIIGSALMAKEGRDDNQMGTSAVKKLVEALDSYVPTPVLLTEGPFLMPIETVSSISGGGTIVSGRIERGVIKIQQEIEIVGLRDTFKTVCTGIEMSRTQLQEARAGENCTILLGGTQPEDVERGQVLASPGTATPHTRFVADFYMLSKEEGGLEKPFYSNYRPQFYFRTIDVTGTCGLPDNVTSVMPGDNITLSVTLTRSVAMEEGLRFAMREGGRTVGAGVVTKILE